MGEFDEGEFAEHDQDIGDEEDVSSNHYKQKAQMKNPSMPNPRNPTHHTNTQRIKKYSFPKIPHIGK